MHYKNGRKAEENDHVICLGWEAGKNRGIAGRIHSLNEASTSCNGIVCYPMVGGVAHTSVTVGDCVHVDDALEAFNKALTEAANAVAPKATEAAPASSPENAG